MRLAGQILQRDTHFEIDVASLGRGELPACGGLDAVHFYLPIVQLDEIANLERFGCGAGRARGLWCDNRAGATRGVAGFTASDESEDKDAKSKDDFQFVFQVGMILSELMRLSIAQQKDSR